MIWKYTQQPDESKCEMLAKELTTKDALDPFPLPLARVLLQSGINTFEEARSYFRPPMESVSSPWKMKGMEAAVDRILLALNEKQKIRLYGDYDVDGTTSISLLKYFFDEISFPVDFYVPDRFSEGYGLSFRGMEQAATDGVDLMIVLDCGTKEIEKSRFAAERKMDLIVCDHHTPGKELPVCVALLNPLQEGCGYPDKNLSACGIAFQLARALAEKRKDTFDVFEKWGDLVVLSIASDLVPLRGENRTLAWHGLEKLRANPLPGVKALMGLSKVNRDWNIEDLVFFLGPRINSAGRKTHAAKAVQLLIGDPGTLSELATLLDDHNEWRKTTDNLMTDEALEMIEKNENELNRRSTVLFNENWHKGVIGIVASRLIEKIYRPTVILTKSGENWVGSARSVEGFDLYQALTECTAHLVQFGGHKYAAGLTLKEEQLVPFKEKFEAVVAGRITPDQLSPCLDISTEADFSYINDKFVRILQQMGPFGPENMEPVFLTRKTKVAEVRILQGKHLRLTLENSGKRQEAIGFNLASQWEKEGGKVVDLAWQAAFNHWKGKRMIQLKIKDFKISD